MKSKKSRNGYCALVACRILSLIISTFTVLSSFLFVILWSSLMCVEEDLKHDVNSYLMLTNHFTEQHDFYLILKAFSLTLSTVYFALFLCYIFYSRVGAVNQERATTCGVLRQVFSLLVAMVNLVLLRLLLTTGYKIWQLFLLSVPLAAVRTINHSGFILTVPATIIVLLYFHFRHTCIRGRGSLPTPPVLVGMVVLLVITVSLDGLARHACTFCSSEELPAKPVLTAHRGCPSEHPGNSIKAFEAASQIDSVITLESDVWVSSDGELFLLHDPFLIRTTSIVETCPGVDSFTLASKMEYYSGECPIKSLYLKEDHTQSVPTLKELLQIAKEKNKNVMFDLSKPPIGHSHSKTYIDLTFKAITESGLDLEKIWWLHPFNFSSVISRYPQLTLVAKSQYTSLEDFEKLKIKIANEEWTTPPIIIRKLQLSGVSVSMYTISTMPLFEYAWCLGVSSITTNQCSFFSRPSLENHLYKYCHSRWPFFMGSLSLVCTTVLCCVLLPTGIRYLYTWP